MPPPGYGVDGDILNPLVEESGGNSGGRLMGWAGTFLHRGQNECKIINGRNPVRFQKPGLTGQSLATSFRAVRQTIAKLQPLSVFTEEK
jgi:hypothetical protein